jgi:hypothetical protein
MEQAPSAVRFLPGTDLTKPFQLSGTLKLRPCCEIPEPYKHTSLACNTHAARPMGKTVTIQPVEEEAKTRHCLPVKIGLNICVEFCIKV